MTKPQANTTKTAHPTEPDRLSHAINFANELNESRLCKIRISYERRWTRLKRTRQSVRIRLQKPWICSSGPKTMDGKATSSRNALKGDLFDRAVFLPALRANANFLRAVSLLIRLKRQNHPAAKDLYDQCLVMGHSATADLLAAMALGHTIFLPNTPENPVYLRPI